MYLNGIVISPTLSASVTANIVPECIPSASVMPAKNKIYTLADSYSVTINYDNVTIIARPTNMTFLYTGDKLQIMGTLSNNKTEEIFFFLIHYNTANSTETLINKAELDKGILINLTDSSVITLNSTLLSVTDSISAHFAFNTKDSITLKLEIVKCTDGTTIPSVAPNPEEPNSGFIFYIAAALMVGIVAIFIARRRGVSFPFFKSRNNGTNGNVTATNSQYAGLPTTDEESRQDNDDNTNNDNYTDVPLVNSTPPVPTVLPVVNPLHLGRSSNPVSNNNHTPFPTSNGTSASSGSIPKKSRKENLKENLKAVPVKQNPVAANTTTSTPTNSLAYNPDDNDNDNDNNNEDTKGWDYTWDDDSDNPVSTKKEKPDKKD